MSNVTHGMNVEEVQDLGRFLQQRADRLNQIVQEINRAVYSVQWQGGVAVRFGQQHWPAHRARLQRAAKDLRGLGQSAINNASEQRSVSEVRAASGAPVRSRASAGVSGLAGVGIVGLAGSLGGALRGGLEVTSPLGALGSSVHELAEGARLQKLAAARRSGMILDLGTSKSSVLARKLGDGASGFGHFVNGFTIGEDLADRRYVDAGLDTGLAAGELVAQQLKHKPTAVSYLGGVAVQTWVEVAREARNVDWSAEGARQIQQASLSDWGGAFGEALTKMPSKLVSILG